MTKEQVIQGYLMNSPKVVAEMLYDTIEKYENRSCEGCKYHLSDKFHYPLHPCCECSRFFIDSWQSN